MCQRSTGLFFLCKGQPLHFKGHPKKYDLKGAWGQGGTSHPTAPFSAGETWETFLGSVTVTRQFHGRHCAMGRAGRAGDRGWEEVGEACPVPTYFFTPPPPLCAPASVRFEGAASTAGFWRAPTPGPESLASLQGPGVEKRGCCPCSGPDAAPARFPGCAWGREGPAAKATPGDRLAAPIAAGNSNLALSVRKPGLPAAAPRPRLALSDGDAVGRVLRNRRKTRNPPSPPGLPRRLPPPRRPRARARRGV